MQISRSSSKHISKSPGLISSTPSNLRVAFPKLSKSRYSLNNYVRKPEKQSHEKETYSIQSVIHAGMKTKPLVPYKPECSRSRLLSSEVLMPHRNISSFAIGDLSRYKAIKVFKTSYQLFCNSCDGSKGMRS